MNEQTPTPLWQTRKFRIGALITVITALMVTLILQNFDTTEVQFFFWRAEAPLAGVIFTSMLIGVGLQVLIKMWFKKRRRKRETLRATPTQTESTES